MKNLITLSIMIFFCVSYYPAQTLTSGLLIQEVHLSEDNPELNWIKVVNPQQVNEEFGFFRISHVRRPNMLPIKAFQLIPGDIIVLCSDIQSYKKFWKGNFETIEIKSLQRLTKGGFIAIGKTAFTDQEKIDVVRYGDYTKTEKLEGINNYGVVPFSKDNKVYSRISMDKKKYNKYAEWE